MHPFVRLAQLFVRLGTIDGRKKLQKLVHILQCKGAPFSEQFELSHFGAYSSELRGEISNLIGDGLLTESLKGSSSYSYAPTGELVGLLSDADVPLDDGWLDLAAKLNERTPQELEGISTVLYLIRWGWRGAGLRQQFEALKPHLAPSFQERLQEAETLAW